jgi:hypothetical protein
MAARLWPALVLVAGVFGVAAGAAANPNGIECDRLSFRFAPAGNADQAECYRIKDSEASGSDGIAEHTAVYEHMFVYQGAEVIRITSGRAVENVYFYRRPLRGYIDVFDELEDVKQWSTQEDYGDYEIAEFSATLENEPAICFGFLTVGANVVSARGSAVGPGSFMVGYDCQFGTGELSRSLIERTLSQIE